MIGLLWRRLGTKPALDAAKMLRRAKIRYRSHPKMALFKKGDLMPSLYESELATGLLPNKITDLSSLSNSGEARSPILNRALSIEVPGWIAAGEYAI